MSLPRSNEFESIQRRSMSSNDGARALAPAACASRNASLRLKLRWSCPKTGILPDPGTPVRHRPHIAFGLRGSQGQLAESRQGSPTAGEITRPILDEVMERIALSLLPRDRCIIFGENRREARPDVLPAM